MVSNPVVVDSAVFAKEDTPSAAGDDTNGPAKHREMQTIESRTTIFSQRPVPTSTRPDRQALTLKTLRDSLVEIAPAAVPDITTAITSDERSTGSSLSGRLAMSATPPLRRGT
jgi:hypothetical protein